MKDNKWGKGFWADLGERVIATFLGALLTFITMDNVLEAVDFQRLWPILVLPTLVSLIKGLLANLINSDTGASLLTSPPGPVIDDSDQVYDGPVGGM